MKRVLIYIFFGSLLTLYSGVTFGQSCTELLEQAQLRYDEGKVEEIEGLLLRCLNSNSFDRQQKQQAMKLITLAYILQEEGQSADSSMYELVKAYHEFQPDYQLDPVEFINIYKSYRTDPIFAVGIKGGVNYSIVDVKQLNTTGQAGDSREFRPSVGLQFSIVFEKELIPGLRIAPQIDYSSRVVQYKETFQNLATTFDSNGDLDQPTQFDGKITFNSIDLPILVQYEFLDQKIRPYAVAGITVSYLLNASMESIGSFNQLVRPAGAPITLRPPAESDVTGDFVRWNFFGSVGGGVKVKLYEGYLNLEARYNYPFTQISSGSVPQEQDLIWRLKNLHSQFNLQFATITLGYSLNIYRQKKL